MNKKERSRQSSSVADPKNNSSSWIKVVLTDRPLEKLRDPVGPFDETGLFANGIVWTPQEGIPFIERKPSPEAEHVGSMISRPDFSYRKQLLLVRAGIVEKNQGRLRARFCLVGRDKSVSAIRVGPNAGLTHDDLDMSIYLEDTVSSTFD
jgi:hypothetical protein